METHIDSWDGGLGIHLPIAMAETLGFSRGTLIDISAADGGIFLRPMKDPLETMKEMVADVDIEAMCANITPENSHPETYWGAAVGNEIIEDDWS